MPSDAYVSISEIHDTVKANGTSTIHKLAANASIFVRNKVLTNIDKLTCDQANKTTPKKKVDDFPFVAYVFPFAKRNPKHRTTALIVEKIPYPIK